MKVLNITNSGTQWRVFEKEKIEEHFGEILDIPLGDLVSTQNFIEEHGQEAIVFWRPNSDSIGTEEYTLMQEQRKILNGCSFINDPNGYLNYHAKEKAFEIWDREKIRCPAHCLIEDTEEFLDEYEFEFPFLIRLNNEVTGQASYLVNDERELLTSLKSLEADYYTALRSNPFTQRIAVQFVDATKENGKYNLSYRIIVAGDKVVTGYARLSEASDWVAITGKFKPEMQDNFVKYQKRCQSVVEENHDTIVRAVHSLGLNHQGVDAIEDQKGNLYFLECQPGYSTGYAHWAKPFYNPYYPELVNFLVENKNHLQEEIPMYYDKWLDKEVLFEEVMSNLKEHIK